MKALAIETVGTQEIQGGIFNEFISGQVGPGVRVEGRRIGQVLVAMSDEELDRLLGDVTEAVRAG